MEGGFFWIYGGFWDGKTLWAVIMILMKLQKGEIVFTNISLDRKYLPNPDNYFYFESMDHFYDILAMSWLFAMKVSEFSKKQLELGYPAYPRGFRPRINVFFDEMGIFANAKDFKEIHAEYWKDLQQYILQLRKLHVTCFLIIQRPKQLVSDLRGHVSWWLKFKPLFWWGFFQKYAGTYWLQELDQETYNVVIEKRHWTDEKGNLYSYDVPMETKAFRVWYKPRYYKYYDDLYLNKIFDTKEPFRSNYLFESNFFAKLQSNSINNKSLIHNKHIYENYFKNSGYLDSAFDAPKVGFRDNPSYYLHYNLKKFSIFMTKKRYTGELIKGLYTYLRNKSKKIIWQS